ncbi:MAG: GntP family permease [Roseibacillus sp.]|nr:GntP family permease [Roseibacillus sp.]
MSPVVICLIGMVVVAGTILKFRLHPFLALMLGAVVVGVLAPGEEPLALVGKRLGAAFGSGCGKVGLVIAMAAVIGQCLLASGAAERIVRGFLSLFGVKRAPLGFLSSGFLLGIPVFFDTVFYLMVPLVRTFAKANPEKFILALLAVVAGGSMAHSLVPPTPGPLLVVSDIDEALRDLGRPGLDLSVMILGGLLLGVITMTVGYLYARWANNVFRIEMRETALSLDEEFESDPGRQLPSLGISLLPIVVPFVLIMAGTIVVSLHGKATDADYALGGQIVLLLGNKNMALGVGALIAILILVKHRPPGLAIPRVLQSALAGGGTIILITAAGSAFGSIMKDTGIADTLKDVFSGSGHMILPVAFLCTALIRMAQGSATVSMITCGALMASLLENVELTFHPVYLALAIGCGSKPGPWMNDSGFWVISRMSGMTEGETLKTFSVMLTLMGVAGFVVVWIASRVIPLV